MQRIIVFSIVVIFLLIIDYYFFQAIKTLTRTWTDSSKRLVTIGYWSIPVLSVLLVIAGLFFYPGFMSAKVRNFLMAGIFIVYISKILGAVFLLIGDLANIVRHFGKKVISPSDAADSKITRADFIAQGALAVGGLNLGAMTWGILSGAHDYRIKRVTLNLKNLPKAFNGMTIAQLSDIHSGSFFNKTAVQGGVDMLLGQKPDVVFFTGDLVNNEAKELNDYFDVFKKVNAPLGVFSTLGNHDYGDYIPWKNEKAKIDNLNTLIEGHRLMGWDLLMDGNRTLTVDGEKLSIVGIQNWGMGGFKKMGDLNKALKGTEELPVKLLLSHDPSHWRAQVLNQTDVDVSFAGHTHGMQFGVEIGGFKWSPVQYRYKEWAGLYQENDQQLYVNRGFGFIGYPGRVGILPEITIFTLKTA